MTSHRIPRALLSFALLAAVILSFGPVSTLAVSNTVVISEFRTRGPKGGNDEFIELYNLSSSPVNIGGWKVAGSNDTGATSTRATIPANTTLNAGCHYLLANTAASGYSETVTPDQTYATGITDDGGIAIINGTTIIDAVGMSTGSAYKEGTTLAQKTNNLEQSYQRMDSVGNVVDTDNNAADFVYSTSPTPQNLSASCGAPAIGPSGSGAASPATVDPGDSTLLTVSVTPGSNPVSTGLTATADLSAFGGSSAQQLFDDGTNGDVTAGDSTFSYNLTVPANVAGSFTIPVKLDDAQGRAGAASIMLHVNAPQVTIPQIQGSGAVSPYNGSTVQTSGVVTAVVSSGFFIQDPQGDGDPNTSDGIFVFTSSKPTLAAGDSVNVTGVIAEYPAPVNPGDPSATEIDHPSITTNSSGNAIPAAVTLAPGALDPNGGFNQLERYEGMRVHIDTLNVVGPTDGTVNETNATSTSNGLFYGVLPGTPRPFRDAGIEAPATPPAGSPCCVPEWDSNPERLLIGSKDISTSTAIDVTTGAVVTDITGPLDLSGNVYEIHTDHTPAFTGNVSFTAVPLPDTSKEFTVASFNMERFFDTTDDPSVSDVALTPQAFANRLNKSSLAIRNVLNSPDIVGVEEMENITTLQAVANKVNSDALAATGVDPQYQAYLVEGNDIGGIDVGFLVKSTRVHVNSVTQFGKDTTFTNASGQQAELNDRPPLVLDASITNQHVTTEFTVIVNHLRSLIDVNDDPTVRLKREAQAEYLANLIQGYQSGNPAAKIVSIGDYNAFNVNDGYVDSMGIIEGNPAPADEDTLSGPDLVDPNLTDLLYTLPAAQQYSYSETGTAQTLDHVLVNPAMASLVTRFAIARNDADFPETFRNDPNRPERTSDHDMPEAYFSLPVDTPPTATNQSVNVNYGSSVTFALSASDPDAGQTLTYNVTTSPAKGMLSISNGNATYTPNYGASGTDSFTYTVTDDAGESATATVIITIVPVNVSSSVMVTSTGNVYNRATRLYSSTVTLKNTSQTAITGPITVLFGNVPAGVTVANASGTHNGSPYITVPVTSVAPGASTSFTLQLSNPSNVSVNLTTTEYSGSF
jgi:hypothetical protein